MSENNSNNIGGLALPSTPETGFNQRNLASSSTPQVNKQGSYRSHKNMKELTLNSLKDAVENSVREADAVQAKNELKSEMSLVGIGTSSKTVAKTTLESLYSTRHYNELKQTLGEGYRIGKYRGFSLSDDYRANVKAVNRYLQSKGVSGVQNLTKSEINKALLTGKLSRLGHKGIKVDPQMRVVLKEAARLKKLEGVANKAKGEGKIKGTAKAWARKTVQDSDANKGIKIAKSITKTSKIGIKGVKKGTQASLTAIGKVATDAFLAPANMIIDGKLAKNKIIELKLKHDRKMGKNINIDKLNNAQSKISSLKTKKQKLKDIKSNSRSKLSKVIHPVDTIKGKTSAKLTSLKNKRLDKKKAKLGEKLINGKISLKKYNRKIKNLGKGKLGKVGSIIRAPFNIFNGIKSIKMLLFKIALFAALMAGVVRVFYAPFMGYQLDKDGETQEVDEEMEAYVESLGEDEESIIETTWADYEYEDDNGNTSSYGDYIVTSLYTQEKAFLINLTTANAASKCAKYGIPSNWDSQIIEKTTKNNKSYITNDMTIYKGDKFVGYNLSTFWGPNITYKANLNFTKGTAPIKEVTNAIDTQLKRKAGTKYTINEKVEFEMKGPAGLSTINWDLGKYNSGAKYDFSDIKWTDINSVKVISNQLNMKKNPNIYVNVNYENTDDQTKIGPKWMYTVIMLSTHLYNGGDNDDVDSYAETASEIFEKIMDNTDISIKYEIKNGYKKDGLSLMWNNKKFSMPPKECHITIDINYPDISMDNIQSMMDKEFSDSAVEAINKYFSHVDNEELANLFFDNKLPQG